MTLIAFIALLAGAWGTYEKAQDLHGNARSQKLESTLADLVIAVVCGCVLLTAGQHIITIWK